MVIRKEIQNLIFDFFQRISIFEYTLKYKGYFHQKNTNCYVAKPDWDAFINRIKPNLPVSISDINDPLLENGLKYLMNHPPQKQIIQNNTLSYSRLSKEMDEDSIDWNKVVVYIRRVRNNLFHGEKNPFENERDVELIESSLLVIDLLSKQLNDFYAIYEKRLFAMDI
jgi:hypothetical protein